MYLRLTDDNLREIVYERNLPADFKTNKGVEESAFQLEHRLGSAEFKELWFEGVHISHGHILLRQDTVVNVEADMPVIEMHFNIAGDSHAMVKGTNMKMHFAPAQHNLYYYPRFNGELEARVDKTRNEMLEIHFTESYFGRLAASDNPMLTGMQEKIEKGQVASMGRYNGQITTRMAQLIRAIKDCDRQGILKRLAVESCILELLLLQVEQFETASSSTLPALSRCDIEKLQQVRYLLEQNPQTPYSLVSLARMVGLNDFKLKKGFKTLFGTTVFGYLSDLRMQEAQRLLLDHRQTISDVAAWCGYEHVQHFTTAFKKKFGVTPGKMRNA